MFFYNDLFGGRLWRRIYFWLVRGELVIIVFSFELGVFRVFVRVVVDWLRDFVRVFGSSFDFLVKYWLMIVYFLWCFGDFGFFNI